MNAESLAAWQMAQVRRLLAKLKSQGFYKKALSGVETDKIMSYSDMELLPFTSPEQVKSFKDELLLVSARDISRITTLRTSGSTDIAKRISFSDADLLKTMDFFSCGMSGMVGEGDSVAILLSSDIPDSIADLLSRALLSIGAKPVIYGHITDIDGVGRILSESGYDCLVGIPSEIRALSLAYPNLRPRSLLLTADYVAQSLVRIIKEMWRCSVFTHYGMTETGFGCAVQCAAGDGHHIRHSDMLIEIVDPVTGKQLPCGREGEITVTAFGNEAMPLLRYRTGDISSLTAKPCACGGIFPRLGRIKGRLSNIITLNGDVSLSIEALDEVVYSAAGVRSYGAEITETRPGKQLLTLTVDADESLSPESLRQSLSSYLKGAISFRIRQEQLPFLRGAAKRRIDAVRQADNEKGCG